MEAAVQEWRQVPSPPGLAAVEGGSTMLLHASIRPRASVSGESPPRRKEFSRRGALHRHASLRQHSRTDPPPCERGILGKVPA